MSHREREKGQELLVNLNDKGNIEIKEV